MKKRSVLLALLLALCLCAAAVPARADEAWSEEYYRAWDSTEELSDAERIDLDEQCLAVVREYGVDLALLAVVPEDYEGGTLDELAEQYWEICGFGYGAAHSGVLVIYETERESVTLRTFGGAEKRVPAGVMKRVEQIAPTLRADHGIYGVLYGAVKILSDYLEETAQQGGAPVDKGDAPAGLPSWYPADPKNFTFFHDAAAPRVVDAADIFTAAEESAMEARLAELRAELGRDIVIYTDVTAYGLGHSVCAADFYDFNGYGIGEEREGICLFVCMDPADRGWWVCCTGSDTMGLYTEPVANDMDDALYEYMAAGLYGEGAADWIENVRSLYRTGLPFAPDWYPARGEERARTHDAAAPRVVDDAGILTAEEIAQLEAQAAELSRRWGMDVVIHTAVTAGYLTRQEYSDLYYYHNGYGFGENYDGLLLTVFQRPGYYPAVRMTASGTGAEKLTEVNEERLLDRCKDLLDKEEYYQGLSQWLGQVDHMRRTGRVPHKLSYWLGSGALGALLGSLFGGVSLGGAKRKMKTPKLQENADAYLADGSLRVVGIGDMFLGSSTSRRYAPVESRSSSGGHSGGHSSYSSSYHGSSGSSHSGSGRRF